jgi:hypothetical protein
VDTEVRTQVWSQKNPAFIAGFFVCRRCDESNDMAKIKAAKERRPAVDPGKPRLLGLLGPGRLTGTTDDVRAELRLIRRREPNRGFAISRTRLFSYPLMAVIQEISGRIGPVTGRGIAARVGTGITAFL